MFLLRSYNFGYCFRFSFIGAYYHVVLYVALCVYFVSFSDCVTFFSLFFGVCACAGSRIGTYSKLPVQRLGPYLKEMWYSSFAQKRSEVQLGIGV